MALKNLPKRAMENQAARSFVSFLITTYIRLVRHTSSWRLVGAAPTRALTSSDKGFIIAFWHQNLLMAPIIRDETDKRFWMLISAHRDGEIIANAVKPFKIDFIRGSAANPKKAFKDKSGVAAIGHMGDKLQQGDIVGVTPDGPRGPGRRAQPGIARLSLMTGAPIVPFAYATSRGKRLNSWDKFWIAFPFSQGVFAFGEPLYPPQEKSDQSIADYKNQIEAALNKVTRDAQSQLGRSPDIDQMG